MIRKVISKQTVGFKEDKQCQFIELNTKQFYFIYKRLREVFHKYICNSNMLWICMYVETMLNAPDNGLLYISIANGIILILMQREDLL